MVLGSGDGKSKPWIHSPESLVNGKVTYVVKFIGQAEVPEPRGMAMVKMALQKLSFSRQLKRSEGSKPPKVELGISIHSVSISDPKTKETLHDIALHKISFCADDKEDKRLFAFIAKLNDKQHYCYGLDSLHQANDITLTIGQAFELAYEKFRKDNPAANPKKISEMSRRIQQLESENNELRRRIAELEASQKIGNGVGTSSPPKVDAKLTVTSSPGPFNAQSIAIPRRNNPAVPVSSAHQEAIVDHPDTSFELVSRTSLSSSTLTLPNTQQDSSLITLNSNSNETCLKEPVSSAGVYASISRAAKPQDAAHDSSGISQEANTSSVSRSVRKFRNSLQRNMRKTMASEEKMKKTLTSLFPSKIISKKLKRTKLDDTDRKFALLDDSPASSCSSPRSSAYANLDDVIATLQKMMDTDEKKQNRRLEPANFIGEKLATYHDTAHQNYDTLSRHPPKLPKTYGQNHSESSATIRQNENSFLDQSNLRPKTSILVHAESPNSNDDASSLSTTTTDSSTKECVYVLQPTHPVSSDFLMSSGGSRKSQQKTNSKPRERIQPHCKTASKQGQQPALRTQYQPAMKKQNDNSLMTWPGTNIDSTLRQLGGEEGYMLLSGRKQIENILASTRTPYASTADDDVHVDSTYDNVNRLMEAVREAAAKDAAREGEDVKKVLTTPATVAPVHKSLQRDQPPQSDRFRPHLYNQGRQTQPQMNSSQGRIRIASTSSIATDLSNIDGTSFHAFHEPVHVSRPVLPCAPGPSKEHFVTGRNIPTSMSLYQTSPFYPTTASSRHSFVNNMQFSQETDILHNQEQMSPPSSSLGLTSEDAFNMQPFVPQSTIGLLPQPPSRKSNSKPQENLWSTDPLLPIQKQKIASREFPEMQSLSEASLSDTTPKSKKGNYHILSHPLIRKKHRSKGRSALKWSKKYFPNGKKKCCKTSLITKGGSPVAEDQSPYNDVFSKGLLMSDDNLTLDSFDPLKH